MKKKKEEWVDDGRTIVSMDVPGIPGRRRAPALSAAQERIPIPTMDRRETRRYIFAATGAGLLVALVMIAVMVLVVLFTQYVWLK